MATTTPPSTTRNISTSASTGFNSDKIDTRRKSENEVSTKLLDILDASPIPLSTRDLDGCLRNRHLRLADYEVGGRLRAMMREGRVELRRGRWVSSAPSKNTMSGIAVSPPRLSSETFSLP